MDSLPKNTEKLLRLARVRVALSRARGDKEIELNSPLKNPHAGATAESNKESTEQKIKRATGYEVSDIVKAPIDPPKPNVEKIEKANATTATPGYLIGSVLASVGLLSLLLGGSVIGLLLGIIGAVIITVTIVFNPYTSH